MDEFTIFTTDSTRFLLSLTRVLKADKARLPYLIECEQSTAPRPSSIISYIILLNSTASLFILLPDECV